MMNAKSLFNRLWTPAVRVLTLRFFAPVFALAVVGRILFRIYATPFDEGWMTYPELDFYIGYYDMFCSVASFFLFAYAWRGLRRHSHLKAFDKFWQGWKAGLFFAIVSVLLSVSMTLVNGGFTHSGLPGFSDLVPRLASFVFFSVLLCWGFSPVLGIAELLTVTVLLGMTGSILNFSLAPSYGPFFNIAFYNWIPTAFLPTTVLLSRRQGIGAAACYVLVNFIWSKGLMFSGYWMNAGPIDRYIFFALPLLIYKYVPDRMQPLSDTSSRDS